MPGNEHVQADSLLLVFPDRCDAFSVSQTGKRLSVDLEYLIA